MNEEQKRREMQVEEMTEDLENTILGLGIHLCEKSAEKLLNLGYRKLPEDSVVLSREELSKEPYNDFCKGCPNVRVRSSGMTDCCADYSCEQFQKYARLIEHNEQIRKETAREILQTLYNYPHEWHEMKIKELAKEYGVEVEK